jgi:hypothetical protein
LIKVDRADVVSIAVGIDVADLKLLTAAFRQPSKMPMRTRAASGRAYKRSRG